MPTFISLINWTDQGVKNVKQSPNRVEAARALFKKFGGELKQIYFTSGQYDIVAIAEVPDGEVMSKVALTLGGQGNIRTQTVRAFTEAEFQRIVGDLP